MCTVTYLPLGNNNFILTSNRDEQPGRQTIAPQEYSEDGVLLTYPKDVIAGGTWIGLSSKSRLVCLLNGGFDSYERQSYYRMSRGVIVKAILKSDKYKDYINGFDFVGIEPFTIVLVDWASTLIAYELVWDGEKKHFNRLKEVPRIWSSSTLYTRKEKDLRVGWFNNWLVKNQEFNQNNILKFHNDTQLGSRKNSLKMKRDFVETVSVTSVKKENSIITMDYFPLT